MKLYRIMFDSGVFHVVAPSFGTAIETWQAWAEKHWGDEWNGDEQPESVELLDSEHPVIRANTPFPKTGDPPLPGQTAPELDDERRARKTVATYASFADLERAF